MTKLTYSFSQIRNMLQGLSDHYGRQDWWQSEEPLADLISMILIQ